MNGDGLTTGAGQMTQTVVWEFWSQEHECYGVWSEGLPNEYLVSPREWPYPFLPFIDLRVGTVTEAFYPPPQLSQVLLMQEALSDGQTGILAHRNQALRQWAIDAAYDDAEFRDALQNSGVDGVVPSRLKGAQKRLSDVIQPLPNMPTPSEWHQADRMFQANIRSSLALDDFLVSPTTRKSATEANIAEERRSARAAEMNNTFEGAAVEVARKVIGLAQKHLIVGESVMPEDAERYEGASMAISRTLAAEQEFRFDVAVGSMAPKDDLVNRAHKTEMLRMLMPFLSGPQPVLNVPKFLEEYLRAQGIADPESYLASSAGPPPPMQAPGMAGPGMGEMPASPLPGEASGEMIPQPPAPVAPIG